jgi:hypothetical protein
MALTPVPPWALAADPVLMLTFEPFGQPDSVGVALTTETVHFGNFALLNLRFLSKWMTARVVP